MSYVKNVWFDGETSGTPIIAEKMNHIEEGIEELSEALSSIVPVLLEKTLTNITGNYNIQRYGKVIIVSLNGCILGSTIPASNYLYLSHDMPKPVAFSCATLMLNKTSTNFFLSNLAIEIGTDGVMSIGNENASAQIQSGNEVFGQLVYITTE